MGGSGLGSGLGATVIPTALLACSHLLRARGPNPQRRCWAARHGHCELEG